MSMHSFRPADDPERRKWQDPEAVLAEIGLKAGMTFADIGSGGGFFALPAARMVGRKGLVYALDVSGNALDDLRRQAASQGLENIDTVVGKAEETVFCKKCADIVFLGIDLHDFADPAKALQNVRGAIKPGGKLVDLDWKTDAPFGPPPAIRFSEKKATGLIEAAGFRVVSVRNSGEYHYIVEAVLRAADEAAAS